MASLKKVLFISSNEDRKQDLSALYLNPQHICKQVQEEYEVLALLREEIFEIVLLDLTMVEVNISKFCSKIKDVSDIPIMIVAACEQQDKIVKGLQSGADDYIIKPFSAEELLVRIEILTHRKKTDNHIEINGLLWDEDRHVCSYHKKAIKLTPKEFTIMGHLMKHTNQVFAREQLIDLIWGYNSVTDGRTVDSHVQNMRVKIRNSGFPIDDYVKTVWGVGYKWTNRTDINNIKRAVPS
ncbi:response regulator transcription factor [Virgibacillus byunsanensis]|uniref:Response regulator transcription factor n=1 Tax=Virgibacillus byunsanensis TaxID=570945 RepID=A0ABW3LIS6_9BACI